MRKLAEVADILAVGRLIGHIGSTDRSAIRRVPERSRHDVAGVPPTYGPEAGGDRKDRFTVGLVCVVRSVSVATARHGLRASRVRRVRDGLLPEPDTARSYSNIPPPPYADRVPRLEHR